MANDDLLSVREAAAELHVHDRTIRRWISIGKLRAYRAGNRIRIRRGDLDKMLEEIEPASEPDNEQNEGSEQ